MSKRLHNSLIDFLVVAGYDEDTGLIPENDVGNELSQNDVFSVNYEVEVLANINSDMATYPQRDIKINMFYPYVDYSRMSFDDSIEMPSEMNQRKLTRRGTIKPPEKSITPEVLDNLAQFCYPGGTSISKKTKEPKIHWFVLTDIEGNKTFVISMNFYREFYCCIKGNSDEDSTRYDLIRIDDEQDLTEENKNYMLVYVPTSIMLLSKYFYFNVLKECLSSLYEEYSENTGEFQRLIEKYAFQLTNTPVPPNCAERFGLTLEYDLFGKTISLFPGDEYTDNVFDLNLSLIFHKFNLDDVIQVILGLLSEQKFVFISKDYSVLTPVIECFLRLVHPFKWQPTYVPILPSSRIDFIEAPNPFIMGCNSIYKSQIIKNQEVVLVDIDIGTVIIPACLNIINFPLRCIDFLKTKFEKIDVNEVETNKLTCLIKNDLESHLKFEKALNQTLNQQLINLFLEFYVDVFGDIYSFMKIQPREKFFNKKKYLEEQLEIDKQFYEQVTNTLIFDNFIDDRIKNYSLQINDQYFTILDQLKFNKPKFSASEIVRSTLLIIPQPIESNNKPLSFVKSIRKTLKMPKFDLKPNNYRLKCIELLTQEMKTANSFTYQDCLRYLRGLLTISVGRVNDGFRCLYEIECQLLFPKSLIENTILTLMNQQVKESIFESDFLINSPEWKKISRTTYNRYLSICHIDMIEDSFIDIHDLSFQEFCERLEQIDIRIDFEITGRLFKALTLEASTKLEISTFEMFIEYWLAREDELQTINKLLLPGNKTSGNEFALKVSSQSINTSLGIGRIVLTHKCLYYLEEGTNRRILLVELKDIKNIEKFLNYEAMFGSGKAALKVTTIKNEPIVLHLMEERNLWFILIEEIRSAIILAEQIKDSSLIHNAAINVLLLNAVIGCGHDQRTMHSSDLQKSSQYLCHYTMLLDGKDKSMFDETNQILRFRINPSNRELDSKNSIECMIYVNHHEYSTLWCAVGNRIKIFDPITWVYEASDIKLKEKITCMTYVPRTFKIWIGTIDQCIYVLDIETTSFERKLEAHNDVIVSVLMSNAENELLSATSNGEITFWNVETFQKLRVIKLSEKTNEFNKILNKITTIQEKIICTTLDKVLIFKNNDFELEKSLSLETKDKLLPISCFCVSYEEYENLIWVGCASNGFIWVWSLNDYELKMRIAVDEITGFRALLYANGSIWAGSKDGKLEIFSTKTFEHEKSLDAHKDTIRSLCLVDGRFVVSGSGSKDGRIAVWQISNILSTRSILTAMTKFLEKSKSQAGILKKQNL